MQVKPSFWRRVNPFFFVFILLVGADAGVFKLWHNPQTLGITALAMLFLVICVIFGVNKVIHLLGEKGAGKKFVAEVVVVHWRGETSRFWGVYRYEWLANFAAQYMAYMLDHLGDVHWEFGVQFRVHDQEKRKVTENSSGPGAQASQPA